MNQKKLNDYKVTASIHTLAIKTDNSMEDVPDIFKDAVTSSSRINGKNISTTSILNLNKVGGEIYQYSTFKETLDLLMLTTGVCDDYSIVRADLRLDSFNEEHYRAYAKLNRYLISALAVTYQVRNAYKTMGLFSQRQRSIAIKNKYFECENYDKEEESNGLDIACSRFEERSKAWNDNNLRREFVEHWAERWDKAAKNIKAVHQKYNDELEKIYKTEKDAFPVQFRTLKDFLIMYQNCIFCKEQMIDLLSRFDEVGADKAKTYAENFKKRYGIEYFSQKDVKKALDEIKSATLKFFDS